MPSQPETASKSTEMRILILGLSEVERGERGDGMVDGGGMTADEDKGSGRGGFEVVPGSGLEAFGVDLGAAFSSKVFSAFKISSSLHTIRPSIPPSTLIHCPEICPAALWLARNAAALATSSG